MKIVVFGGSGFLGAHVCDKLSDAGHKVTIFDKVVSKWIRDDQDMIIGNILDEECVFKVTENSDAVYNFAGLADIDDTMKRPLDTVRTNVLGNSIILEACRIANVNRYVFASSVYVYSNSGSFYRCSKQSCELFIENYKESFGLDYTILRYGSLYGTRSDQRNSIYSFVENALRNKKITYSGSPEAIREYTHVEDAALSSVEILKPEFANQHIILTGHQPMKVKNLIMMISEILDEAIEVKYLNIKGGGHYDITPYNFSPKLGRKLTPVLHTDLGQGIIKVIEELYQQIHPELHNIDGFLVKESE